jgi:glycosyltransferase involved in cell wall biosynthesis
MPRVAVGHDYLTQRGGAERVALLITRAFAGAELHTLLYEPSLSYPEFLDTPIVTSGLNRVGFFRKHHRAALPLLPSAARRTVIDAEVAILSTSGWAHGMTCTGKKLVYCHAPARWLYQRERYIGVGQEQFGMAGALRRQVAQAALGGLRAGLMSWDRKAAASADRYLVNSTITRQAVMDVYGIEAEVLPPPPGLSADGPMQRPQGLEPGFALTVARLLPYKNVDVVVDAVGMTPGQRLVVVGDGPELVRLQRQADSVAPGRVTFLQRVSDEELRWLYDNSALLIAASHEDYGLSPIEAANFGKPTVALEAGGYLDTVVDNVNGVYFPTPTGLDVAEALSRALTMGWDGPKIRHHAERFGPERFELRLHEIVDEMSGR